MDTLSLPEMDGVEQIAWVMKKVILPLRDSIVKVGIDATCVTIGVWACPDHLLTVPVMAMVQGVSQRISHGSRISQL